MKDVEDRWSLFKRIIINEETQTCRIPKNTKRTERWNTEITYIVKYKIEVGKNLRIKSNIDYNE